MPLKLYRRKGSRIYKYRGTIGPTGRRKFFTGSCNTTDKDIAARQVTEIESRYWKGTLDGPESVLTFDHGAALYVEAGKGDRFLPPVRQYLANMLVKDINTGVLQRMAIKLYPDWSGASRNRAALTPAESVINHCAESGLCPRIKVKRFKEETKEKTPVTLEWVLAFAKEATPHLGAYAAFMFFTGARPTEALEADIDLPSCTALLHESKIGHERRAHLPAMLVAMIANLPAVKGRRTFVYQEVDDLRGAWDRTIDRAGIARLTPHCCRHGFITGLLRRGLDVKTVSWLADMTVQTLVNVYAHAVKDRTLTDVLTSAETVQSFFDVARSQLKTGTT